MLIPHNALVMVVDGAHMALFRNEGTLVAPKLDILAEQTCKTDRTSSMGDDRPGRSFQSMGSTRGAYETTDLHQAGEDEFAIGMAGYLNNTVLTNDQEVLLVAPPRVLSVMRTHLNANIRARMVAEIDKDYCGRSATEIAKLLIDYEPGK
jgi:protein required for attachment to host cells